MWWHWTLRDGGLAGSLLNFPERRRSSFSVDVCCVPSACCLSCPNPAQQQRQPASIYSSRTQLRRPWPDTITRSEDPVSIKTVFFLTESRTPSSHTPPSHIHIHTYTSATSCRVLPVPQLPLFSRLLPSATAQRQLPSIPANDTPVVASACYTVSPKGQSAYSHLPLLCAQRQASHSLKGPIRYSSTTVPAPATLPSCRACAPV